MTPLRIGILGCGRIAPLAHLRALSALPGVQLAGVADPLPTRTGFVARQSPGVPLLGDTRELLDAQALDAVALERDPSHDAQAHPALTVALLTPDAFTTVERTVRRVAAQEVASRIELLLVVPPSRRLHIDAEVVREFHSVRVVQGDFSGGSGVVRATAVRAAAAPIIAFAEDHCFPDPGWAEALLRAHGGPWCAVGPVVRNANPETLVSWADLLMSYGPWLAPGSSGERAHLPGHNTSYKVEPLRNLGPLLDELLEAETPLQWRLRAAGGRLYQEQGARVAHTNFSRWSTWVRVVFHAGRVFSATRALNWSAMHRVGFAVASPMVPFVRMVRHVAQGWRAGLPRILLARIVPVLFVGLACNAAGEAVGALTGAGASRARMLAWEFHRNAPSGRRDVAGA